MTQDIKQRVADYLTAVKANHLLLLEIEKCSSCYVEDDYRTHHCDYHNTAFGNLPGCSHSPAELIIALTEREEKLVECLWFYANSDNWKDGSPQVYINGEFLPDEGHLARVALNTRNDKLGINPTDRDVT